MMHGQQNVKDFTVTITNQYIAAVSKFHPITDHKGPEGVG